MNTESNLNLNTPPLISSSGDSPSGGALLIPGLSTSPAGILDLAGWLADRGWSARSLDASGVTLPASDLDRTPLDATDRHIWVSTVHRALAGLRQDFGGPALVVGVSTGASLALQLNLGPADHLVLISPLWCLTGRMKQTGQYFHLPDKTVFDLAVLGRLAYRKAAGLICDVLVLHGLHDPFTDRDTALQLVRRMVHNKTNYQELDAGYDLLCPGSPWQPDLLNTLDRFLETGEL